MISEKRLIQRLTDYWQRLKGSDILPNICKFDKNAIAEIWSSCFWLKIDTDSRGKLRYQYEYIGNNIKEAYGKDVTGKYVTAHMNTIPGAKVIHKIEKCISNKIPHTEQGVFINNDNKSIKFRSCIVPFCSKDSEQVTHILVGLSWRRS